jgi:hypothetical protein
MEPTVQSRATVHFCIYRCSHDAVVNIIITLLAEVIRR